MGYAHICYNYDNKIIIMAILVDHDALGNVNQLAPHIIIIMNFHSDFVAPSNTFI